MESLKSIIAWLLSPFIIGMGIQLLGFLFLKFSRIRLAKGFLITGTAVLLIGALPVLSHRANRARSLIHAPFQPEEGIDLSQPALIVVLGGGFDPDPWLSPTSRLNSTVMARLIEGIRVFRLFPNSRLLVSLSSDGGGVEDKRRTLLELADILDLNPDRLELITEAESTADEAEMAAAIHQDGEQVIIATSANHMPRAMMIFADQGLDSIAAPTDFHYPRKESAVNNPWKQWIPSTAGHSELQGLLYEWAATLAQR